MRVLHVLHAMNYAGTETLLMNIYRNIDRNRIQFDFAVASLEKCDYDDEILLLGGKIIHYPRYNGYNHLAYKKWWDDFLENSDYGIVHGHIGSTASIYLSIAKKKGIYTIAHSHSTNGEKNLKESIYKLYSFPTRYIADYFFGCSKKALIDRYGNKIANNINKSRILKNAIDSKLFSYDKAKRSKIRQEYAINDDVIVIGTVGRLTAVKNPKGIINICRLLKARGCVFKFLWFGKGELKEEIEKIISEYDLHDVIRLCGVRADIYNVLQAFDIFVFPSIYEGLGISSIEAQSAGLITLCSDTIPEEACVTDLCKLIKLDDVTMWCDEIEHSISCVKSDEYSRLDMHDKIVKAGYDIIAVSNWIQNFYFDKYRKHK